MIHHTREKLIPYTWVVGDVSCFRKLGCSMKSSSAIKTTNSISDLRGLVEESGSRHASEAGIGPAPRYATFFVNICSTVTGRSALSKSIGYPLQFDTWFL